MFEEEVAEADRKVDQIINRLSGENILTQQQISHIHERTRMLQDKAGYDQNYDTWIQKNLPERLENILSE